MKKSSYLRIDKPSQENLSDGAEYENEALQVENALATQIAWTSYEELNLLTAREAGLLSDYSNQDIEGQADLLEEQGAELAATFVKAISNIHTNEVRRHLLALVDDLLNRKIDRASYFHAGDDSKSDDGFSASPYSPFLKILHDESSDNFSIGKSSHILSILLCGVRVDRPEVADFFNWIQAKLYNPKVTRCANIC